MNKLTSYILIISIPLLLFILGLFYIEYKPIPTSNCQQFARANITFNGGLFWGCQYQGCGVGCHYYDEINDKGFKIK